MSAGARGAFARARRPQAALLPAALVAAALVAWLVTVARMQGMDDGPGTDLGGLGWYLGVWVTMMAAMMLPAAAPMAGAFARAARGSGGGLGRAARTWAFLGGYLAAWSLYGLLAYGLYRLVSALDPSWLAWDRAGPAVAGGAVAAGGLYELTPLKEVCLRHCRSPFAFVVRRWRAGPGGAFRMGAEHGLVCVGCCWGLMLVLFAVGVMSIFWMLVVAVVIFAEKVLPRGNRLPWVFAAALLALGLWIALASSSVPLLTTPGQHMMGSHDRADRMTTPGTERMSPGHTCNGCP